MNVTEPGDDPPPEVLDDVIVHALMDEIQKRLGEDRPQDPNALLRRILTDPVAAQQLDVIAARIEELRRELEGDED